MKLLLSLLVVAYTTSTCFAGLGFMHNAVNPDYPGHCYDPLSKIAFKPGETRQTPDCGIMTCESNFGISYTSCSPYIIDDVNCKLVERDMSKDFPECCKEYECVQNGVRTRV